MGLLGRIGGAVRAGAATAWRFATRAAHGFSVMGERLRRDSWRAGDGSTSSIVQAALGWILRNFPEAPIRVLEKSEGETKAQATEDVGAKRLEALLRTPNDHYSGSAMWKGVLADYWLDGNGYIMKLRQGGRVVALWWVPSSLLEPRWPVDGSAFLDHYDYRVDGQVYEIPPTEIIHFRWGFDPENIRKGRSPIKTVLREILTDDEAAAYSFAMLRNLGVPAVVISPDEEAVLDDEDAISIKRQFMGQFGGEHRGEPMVVGASTKVSTLSFSPQQMAVDILRRVPEERVSGVIGVPAIIAGLGAGLARSTFANYSEAREAGYEENIIPTQRDFSLDIERSLLPDFVADASKFEVGFDLTEVRVLQEDENKRWERYTGAAAKGVITLATMNRGLGLPVDEKLHNVYLRDARITAVREDAPEAIGEAVEEPTPPEPPAGIPAETPPPAPGAEGTGQVPPVPGAQGGNGQKPAVPAGA